MQTSRSRRAAAGQEYALIIGLVAVIALFGVATAGRSISALFVSAGNRLTNAAGGAGGSGGGTSGATDPGTGAPNGFAFIDLTSAYPGTTADSNAVPLAGFTGPLTATCGGACTAINRNNAGWQAGPVAGFMPGDTIAIRQSASGSAATTTTATVTVGATTSTPWQVTTAGCPSASAWCNGSTSDRAAASCKQLLANGVTTTGTYWLQPTTPAFQGYCDQTTEGGGWTLVASRSSSVAATTLGNYADAAPSPSTDANRMLKSFAWTLFAFTDVRYSVKNYTKNIYYVGVSTALQGSLRDDLVDPMTGGSTNGCCTNTNSRSVTSRLDSIASPTRTVTYSTSRQGWLTDTVTGGSWCWWNEVSASNNIGVGTCDGTTGGPGYRGGVFVR